MSDSRHHDLFTHYIPLAPRLAAASIDAIARNPLLPLILHALPRLRLAVLDPLVIRALALCEFRPHDALHELADEADKVVPPQGILPQPSVALLLLLLEGLVVADFARADPLVLHAGEQVEAYLRGGVARDAALEDGHEGVGEGLRRAGAVVDGRGLEAVELVQLPVHGGVAVRVVLVIALGWAGCESRQAGQGKRTHARDEVVDVVVFGGGALRLVDKGRRARERVVHFADDIRV